MSVKEYTALCMAVEAMNGSRDELKARRSIVLKLMQELGVDTTDWAQINDFCRHPAISGKAFGRLSIEELMSLATKLRSIKRKRLATQAAATAARTSTTHNLSDKPCRQ